MGQPAFSVQPQKRARNISAGGNFRRRRLTLIKSSYFFLAANRDQRQGRCRWSLFLLADLNQKDGHEVKEIRLFYFTVGGESEPTALRSQEFKGEGYRFSRPEGLTAACQLMEV